MGNTKETTVLQLLNQESPRSQGKRWSRLETIWVVGLFVFCLAIACTSFVNPFPHDGWFQSQYKLFIHNPGGDNYTPIGAPALLYRPIHQIAKTVNLSLTFEFYAGSLVHHLLLCLATILLYLSHRAIGLGILGVFSSTLVFLYIESTYLPQAFWSENSVTFLTIVWLYFAILVAGAGSLQPKICGTLAGIVGLTLGLLVVTRFIPIVFLIGTLGFWKWCQRGQRFFVTAATVFLVTFFVIGAAMTANLYRFGRFELSNSGGRHLWNAISCHTDLMLVDSANYRELKEAVPDIQGRLWWEFSSERVSGVGSNHHDNLLKELAWQAILAHPLRFLEAGVERFIVLLPRPPSRIGLDRAHYYNPLGREEMLPPLVGPAAPLHSFLGTVYRIGSWFYPLFVLGNICLGLAACLALPMLERFRNDKEVAGLLPLCKVWLFLFFCVTVGLLCSNLIEQPPPRLNLTFLPLLALMFSIASFLAVRLIGHVFRDI